MTLLLLRHGKSIWNKSNQFTGFKDIPLCEEGIKQAKSCVEELSKYKIDICFTSDLQRAIHTSKIIYEDLNQNYDIIEDASLKERNYGILTGYNKNELKNTYGNDMYFLWKNSFYVRPHLGESLNDVCKRIGKYYDNHILKYIQDQKNVLIVGHSNSLRALLVHLGVKNINNIHSVDFDNCYPHILKF